MQQFVDNMMAVIEAQKQETFDDLDNRAAESMHRLRIQRGEIEKQVKITETGIEAAEAILQRNISAEIIQSKKHFRVKLSQLILALAIKALQILDLSEINDCLIMYGVIELALRKFYRQVQLSRVDSAKESVNRLLD